MKIGCLSMRSDEINSVSSVLQTNNKLHNPGLNIRKLRFGSPCYDLLSCLFFVFVGIMSYNNFLPSLICGSLLIVVGVALFSLYSKYYKTILTLKSIFSSMWLIGVGLSLLRLHPLQTQWSINTYICVIGVYISFMLAFQVAFKHKAKPVYVNKDALGQYLAILGALILAAFCLDCINFKGVPILSNNMSAYSKFGFPLIHYVTVFGCVYPALAVLGITCWKIDKRIKSIIKLELVIIFFIPILAVSRMQLFIEALLLLLAIYVAVFKEKRIPGRYFVFMLLGCLAVWIAMSSLRNQDAEYISFVFKLDGVNSNLESALWQFYLYIAFGFDNLNCLINNFNESTGGLLVARGVLGIFGLDDVFMSPLLGDTSSYRILSTFNTYTWAKDPFMDFGIYGAIMYFFILGLICNYVESKARCNPSPTNLCVYFIFIYGILVCFFNNIFSAKMIVADLLILLLFNGFITGFGRQKHSGT